MEAKKHKIGLLNIDYHKSSIEVFPQISLLKNSDALYLKISKNSVKFRDTIMHRELLFDFDLCLIDREANETVIQLFAIFVLTQASPITDVTCLTEALAFGRSLIIHKVEKEGLKDNHKHPIVIPELVADPSLINHLF